MKKKTIAIIAESIPLASAPVFFLLVLSSFDTAWSRRIISVTVLLAFLGFAFFFVGRRLAKGDRIVRILGVLDWLATLSVVGFYILAIFSFGL